MELQLVRDEIEHVRRQIARQRKDMRDLQRAGISTTAAARSQKSALDQGARRCATDG